MKQLIVAAGVMALSATSSHAVVVMDWDASNYSGTFGDGWTDSAAGIFAQQGGGDGPVLGTATIGLVTADILTFTADSFDVFGQDNHPMAGLQEFTIAAVFRLPGTVDAPDVPENDFWQYNGIVGVEIPAPGVGDWALGFVDSAANGGANVAGGTGLAGGDLGTPSTATADDGQWHTVHFVVENIDGTNFSQTLYVDGVVAGTVDVGTYGGVTQIAESAFAIGARFTGNNGFLPEGDIARIQFDNTALSANDVALQAATFLGEGVPEPGSIALLTLGGLAVLRRRRG